jgi:scyllo-inosamine-4-phosphate amidinotransferase 1
MINSINEWDSTSRSGGRYVHTLQTGQPTILCLLDESHKKQPGMKLLCPLVLFPICIIDEANEDLDRLALTLEDLGVVVHRPKMINFQQQGGMYNYCPRDRLLIYGNTVVDPAMMYPCRDMESEALEEVIYRADTVHRMPRDQDMILDAANVLRLNNKMLYLQSASGNQKAAKWLMSKFPDVEIEVCNFYSGVHIDSTIVPLREGLVMVNASRVNAGNLPRAFDDWEVVWVTDVVAQDFYQYPYASKWIAMNMLVVDPETVIVDKHQTNLMNMLEIYNFTVIPLELRHSRTLGGGFHCVTLDLVRETQ